VGLLSIDEGLCKGDELCVADCPTAILRIDESKGTPKMIPGGEEMCLRCGHCVAVCPHGALDHAEVPLDGCDPVRKELTIGFEQAVQFLRSRRSVRRFKDRPVERDTLRRLIDVARCAPTASNLQPVEWVVIDGREKVQGLAEQAVGWMRSVLAKDAQPAYAPYLPRLVAAWDAGSDAVLRDAPCLVIAMAPKEAANGMVDLALALSYLELAAPTLGLGTCWAGLLQGALLSHPPLKGKVGIPAGYPHHYPMMIGYAKPTYHRLPLRKPAKVKWD